MAIVDVDFVQSISGEIYSDDDWDLVETLIDYVQAEMESYLSRSVEVRTFTLERHTIPVSPNGGVSPLGSFTAPYQYVHLYNPPVTGITEFRINGRLVDPTYYAVQPWGLIYFGIGLEYLNAVSTSSWAYPLNAYAITYTGGLDGTTNKMLQMILGKVVLRELTQVRQGDQGRAGYIQMRVEDYEWRKSEQVVTGIYGRGLRGAKTLVGPFLPAEQAMLDQFRRRVMVAS